MYTFFFTTSWTIVTTLIIKYQGIPRTAAVRYVRTRRYTRRKEKWSEYPVAPVAYQVILKPGIGQFRQFESPRVHSCINSWGLFLVHKLTCGKRESVSWQPSTRNRRAGVGLLNPMRDKN